MTKVTIDLADDVEREMLRMLLDAPADDEGFGDQLVMNVATKMSCANDEAHELVESKLEQWRAVFNDPVARLSAEDRPLVLAVGDPFEGLSLYGPDDADLLYDLQVSDYVKDSWWVLRLSPLSAVLGVDADPLATSDR